MKKVKLLMITLTMCFVSNLTFSQTNFKWDITDSVNMNKDQIYSASKMFIANYWKSAQNVIQNDDKDAGMILIKGSLIEELSCVSCLGSVYKLYYSYTVKIYIKDNKFRITIDDVNNTLNMFNNNSMKLIQPNETYPEKTGLKSIGINEKKYFELMQNLKNDLQNIINDYTKNLNTNNDW